MFTVLNLISPETNGSFLLVLLQLWTVACIGAFLICGYTDIRTRRIPNHITYPCLLGTLLLAFAWPQWTLSALSGGGIAAGIFLLPRLLWGAQKAGMGDVKLATIGGLLLGPTYTLAALTLAYGAALLVLTPLLLVAKRIHRKQLVAFGPYIAVGFIVVLLMLWPTTFTTDQASKTNGLTIYQTIGIR